VTTESSGGRLCEGGAGPEGPAVIARSGSTGAGDGTWPRCGPEGRDVRAIPWCDSRVRPLEGVRGHRTEQQECTRDEHPRPDPVLGS